MLCRALAKCVTHWKYSLQWFTITVGITNFSVRYFSNSNSNHSCGVCTKTVLLTGFFLSTPWFQEVTHAYKIHKQLITVFESNYPNCLTNQCLSWELDSKKWLEHSQDDRPHPHCTNGQQGLETTGSLYLQHFQTEWKRERQTVYS